MYFTAHALKLDMFLLYVCTCVVYIFRMKEKRRKHEEKQEKFPPYTIDIVFLLFHNTYLMLVRPRVCVWKSAIRRADDRSTCGCSITVYSRIWGCIILLLVYTYLMCTYYVIFLWMALRSPAATAHMVPNKNI